MRKIWLVLVCLATAAFLWFASQGILKLWRYQRLTQHTQAEITRWGIERKNSSQYLLYVFYNYEVEGEIFSSKTTFTEPLFLNAQSAEAEGKKWVLRPWKAWYCRSHPSFSSLERIFPYKTCIHALLALGVLVYFFFLRRYLIRIAKLTAGPL